MKTATLTIFNEIDVDIEFSVCVDCSQDGPYIDHWRIVRVCAGEPEKNTPAAIEALHARIDADEHEKDQIELDLLDLCEYDFADYSSEGDYRYAMQHGG